jgi:hypothetical protein
MSVAHLELKNRGFSQLSQPEVQFDFELPGFIADAKTAQARKHRNAWKYLKYPFSAGVLAAAFVAMPGLLYETEKVEIFAGAPKQANSPDATDAKKTIAELKALLARLDEKTTALNNRIASIETNLYRSRAAALGFKNPSIWSVRFDESQPPQQFVFESRDKKPQQFTLKILSNTKDAVAFEVTGSVDKAEPKTAKITQPLKVGVPVELTRDMEAEGMRQIYMSVVEIPNKETAIIAVGPKE